MRAIRITYLSQRTHDKHGRGARLRSVTRASLSGLCVWVTVGAATTVGVAWGIALTGELDVTWPRAANIPDAYFGAEGGWIVWVSAGRWSDRLVAQSNVGLVLYPDATLPDWSSLESHCLARSAAAGPSQRSWDQVWFVTEDAAGWPFRALWSRRDDTTSRIYQADFRTFGRAPRSRDMTTPFLGDLRTPLERVPKRVLTVGFAADTAFWGGALWCIIRGPGALRRWHRAKHRRCLRCGYQLATPTQPICPECGTPVAATK